MHEGRCRYGTVVEALALFLQGPELFEALIDLLNGVILVDVVFNVNSGLFCKAWPARKAGFDSYA